MSICPRCQKNQAEVRDPDDPFWVAVFRLIRSVGARVPPEVCDQCLEVFRAKGVKRRRK